MRKYLYVIMVILNLGALSISVAEQNKFNALCFATTTLLLILLGVLDDR